MAEQANINERYRCMLLTSKREDFAQYEARTRKGKIENGGMAERLNAPVLKTFFAIPASARK